MAHVCEMHGENNHQHQTSLGPFHWRDVAGSSTASQGSLDLRHRWRYPDLGNQRCHLHGRPVHGGRSASSTHPSMPGAKRSMLQGFHTASGAKETLRHLIGVSEECASASLSANSGRTLLAGSDHQFVWASIAQICGLPGVPEWAGWFSDELKTHHAVIDALGIGCDPVIVKQKRSFSIGSAGLSRVKPSDSRKKRVRFAGLRYASKTSSTTLFCVRL